MKEFFNNFKIPLILSACAVVAIIVTLVVVTGGGGSYGLYISSVSGKVSVTNSDTVTNSSGGELLKNGDIITVGDKSSCTLVYKGKKNSEDNYLIIGGNSQIVVSNDFDGKENGELYLRNGSVMVNSAADAQSSVNIRTADSLITTDKSVAKISYSTNEFMAYSDLYTFMGVNAVELYDSMGNIVQIYDAAGNPVDGPMRQKERSCGRVVPASDEEEFPKFTALNIQFDLEELSATDLKNLLTIAAIIGEDFPYSPEELKAAYDKKAADEAEAQPVTTEGTTVTTDNSDDIQTAEPIVTTAPAPTETTLPGQTYHTYATTAAPVQQTTTAAPVETTTTAAPPEEPELTETASESNGSEVYHTVTIVIDGEETIQEVVHGGNALKPEDPVIDGLEFLGWDGSFDNITEDRVITALFNEFDTGSSKVHNVTVVIGNSSNTIQVEDGQSANLPDTVNVEGYIFKGWDKDYSNITSDITISAILEPAGTHTVTFVVGNDTYPVQVEHGGTAMPTYIPSTDSNGNRFVGWDKPISNIITDTTITAVFADDDYHTVTFIIDGQFHSVSVPNGGTAEPPYVPISDSNGNRFLGWDRSLENITSDVTITAFFG